MIVSRDVLYRKLAGSVSGTHRRFHCSWDLTWTLMRGVCRGMVQPDTILSVYCTGDVKSSTRRRWYGKCPVSVLMCVEEQVSIRHLTVHKMLVGKHKHKKCRKRLVIVWNYFIPRNFRVPGGPFAFYFRGPLRKSECRGPPLTSNPVNSVEDGTV